MENKIIKKFLTIAFVTTVLFSSFWYTNKTLVVSAETSNDPKIDFSLEYPTNQDSNTKGYFKLAMQPEQQQTVYIKLTNNNEKPVTINIIKTNALTTQNGGIHYTENEGSKLSYILGKEFLSSQYIKVENNIELLANSVQIIPIELKAPKKNGTYLSGILFTSEQEQGNEKENNDKIQIKSEVRVGTAIQIDVGERKNPKIDIKESIVKVYPSGIQIQTRLENTSPSLVKSYALYYKVFDSQNKLMFEGGSEQFDMAPSSGIMFPSNWNNGKFKEGNYRIQFEIKGEGEIYTKSNDFEVKKDDIKTYKNTNVTSDNKPIVENDNLILIYTLTGVIIILVIYIIITTKRKKQKEEDASN